MVGGCSLRMSNKFLSRGATHLSQTCSSVATETLPCRLADFANAWWARGAHPTENH